MPLGFRRPVNNNGGLARTIVGDGKNGGLGGVIGVNDNLREISIRTLQLSDIGTPQVADDLIRVLIRLNPLEGGQRRARIGLKELSADHRYDQQNRHGEHELHQRKAA